jgi:predicted MFS family arabinose efflux permease
MGLVALMVAVFDHTHSALAVAALLFAGQALPAFVGPAIIARTEASPRRGQLSGLYAFEALATAALAVLLSHFWLPAVLLLVTLDGIAALATSALLRAEVARTARAEVEAEPVSASGTDGDDHRIAKEIESRAQEAEREANAALNVGFSVSFVLGPILGGVVGAAAGAPAALLIDVASFLLCGALLLDVHVHVEESAGDSVRARLRAAWRHINEAPSLRALLLVEGIAIVFLESAGPIEVSYAKATLHAGDRGLGLLMTSWGAGVVLGSVVFARLLRRPLGVMLSSGTLTVGLAYVCFAVAPSLVLACLAAMIGGVGNGVELPSLNSLVQQLTPQHLHGRLMGAVESLTALCLAVGLPLGGALVAISSPRVGFLVVGLASAAAAAALLGVAGGRRRPAAGREEPIAAAAALDETLPHSPVPRW